MDPKTPGLNSRPYWPGGASHDAGEESRLGQSQRTGSQRRRDSSTTPRWLKNRYPPSRSASTTTTSDQATSLWSAVPRRTCSDDPHRHHRRSLRGESRNAVGDLSPVTLNLINPHVGDARLPESKRYGGLRRNVDHSATDELDRWFRADRRPQPGPRSGQHRQRGGDDAVDGGNAQTALP